MLVQYNELSQLAKRCTADQSEAERGIREAEWYDVIPKIGAPLYKAVEEHPERYADLLNCGSLFSLKGCTGGRAMNQGLKTAIAYYAEARICRGNNVQLDRFGAKVKDSEYSQSADYKEIDTEARYLESCGDKAMESVMGFLNAHAADLHYSAFVQEQHPSERNQFEEITFLNRD